MLSEKHVRILQQLRANARMSLARIGRATGIATSTVFDSYQVLQCEANLRHITILDFERLGYPLRKQYLLRTGDRRAALAWLKKHPRINNLYRVDSHDAFFEAIFANMNEAEEFRQQLKQELKPKELKEYDVLEELKHEAFVPTVPEE
jgi:DNA-binding Lrp family transcriptional regulator